MRFDSRNRRKLPLFEPPNPFLLDRLHLRWRSFVKIQALQNHARHNKDNDPVCENGALVLLELNATRLYELLRVIQFLVEQGDSSTELKFSRDELVHACHDTHPGPYDQHAVSPQASESVSGPAHNSHTRIQSRHIPTSRYASISTGIWSTPLGRRLGRYRDSGKE